MDATLLENQERKIHPDHHYLKIKFRGDTSNINGIGTVVNIYYNKQVQTAELSPYRGYMSSVENMLHFGLDTNTIVDSIRIYWPNGKTEKITSVAVDQDLMISQSAGASNTVPFNPYAINTSSWLINTTSKVGLNFLHQENDFVDFNQQRQLPFKYSQNGPVLASGDLNGDGLEDLILGGTAPYPAALFLQQVNERFAPRLLIENFQQQVNDAAICVFDADNDKDLDIYLASGGGLLPDSSAGYADRLLINDGKANFTLATNLPALLSSKSIVRNADIDGDGDQDLLVATAFIPSRYPQSASSYILRNDSKDGLVKFTDATSSVCSAFQSIGLIRDALWIDADGDKDQDLFVTGTWMGIHYFENKKGKLEEVKTDLAKQTGWWNTLHATDIDRDGDFDLVAGNFGTNGYCIGTDKEPVGIFGGDFDMNKRFDMLLAVWKPEVLHGKRKAFPSAGRDLLAEEIPSVKKQYSTYKPYATAEIEKVLGNMKGKVSVEKEAIQFHSVWIENKGKNNFSIHPLPAEAQWSPVYGIQTSDFNGDGFIDVLLSGNEYAMHPHLGRYDASYGLMLKGNGKGSFNPLSIQESGVFIEGNAKGMISLQIGNKKAWIASVNRGQLHVFQKRNAVTP